MKTPDEIKEGIYCCYVYPFERKCDECPYISEFDMERDCECNLGKDTYDFIRQLEHHIGELTEKVAQLEAAQPKWISVEERLPEPNTTVLLIAHGWESQLVYIGKLEKVESEKSWLTGLVSKASEWTVYGFSYLKEPIVTHWMPIPQMPKEDT